jgi:hypothetical protein
MQHCCESLGNSPANYGGRKGGRKERSHDEEASTATVEL